MEVVVDDRSLQISKVLEGVSASYFYVGTSDLESSNLQLFHSVLLFLHI